MAPGRAIDETDPIRVSALFVAIIVITLLFEKFTHWLEHSLKGKTRRGLRHAIHYIEEEILALGLISLLLIVFEEYLIQLCVDKDGDYGGYGSDYDSDYSSDSYPSDNYPSDNYPADDYGEDGDRKRFFFRKLLAGYGDSCPEGEEPFWSANTIHQTHYFIFLVAVIHMLYASAAIVICLLRMRRWKQFEQRPSHQLRQLKNTNLVYGKNAFEYWFWSFWAQFSPTVDESLYLSMRALFIERMEFPDDFDFLSFVVNTLTEEFAIVVRCDWVMWVVAAIWILVPAFLLVTTILAVLIVLLAGTKLEMIGVKLTQLAFLAYGERGNALLKPIKAPTNLLQRSVRSNAPQRKMSHLGLLENQEAGPRLSTKSMSVYGGKHDRTHTGSDELRRVSSFEVDKNFSFSAMSTPRQAMSTPRHGGPPSELREIVTPSDQAVQTGDNRVDAKYQEEHTMPGWMSCCGFLDTRKRTKANFSKNYHLPDSANLFWFQQPQLILKALRFVYFETSMAVAVVCFDVWQDSDFIIEDTDFFHSRWVTVGALIAVGVLCLLHTSFLMLPTYALTMVAGSHCPERVLKVAKKMDIETAEVTRIESLREKSVHTQIQNLTQPPDLAKKSAPKELTLFDDHNEKAITSLVGAMYRGRLQRLVRKTSADSQAISEHINLQRKSTKSIEFPFEPEGAASTDRAGQSSHSSGVDSDEMKGIEAIFGSFEKFLEHVKHAQESIWAMNPSAVFNFDCNTGTYNGNESTPFDRAAINLTWDLLAAKQDTANDDDAEKNGGTKQV